MDIINPLLVNTGKGLSISYKNKHLYSKYNPIISSERFINSISWKENTIYLLPSPLLEYGMDILCENLPPSSTLLKIEIDSSLYELSKDKNGTKLISKSFDFINILHSINFSKYKKCEILRLNGGYDIYKPKYDRLFNILLNSLHSFWKNRYTSTRMGQLWIKNTLVNIKELKDSYPLSSLRTNKPILVTGAGESLEHSIDLIKRYRDKIYILAVDTALQVLLEADIIPDGVLALEAQYYNLIDFYGAKGKEIDLIYDLSSYPEVVRTLSGKKYYVATKFSNSSLLNRMLNSGITEELLPPLGSVGITAIYIALKVTNNSIFLTGLDFSYTIGKTHSKGTPYHLTTLINSGKVISQDSMGNCLKRPLTERCDKLGNIILSDDILYEYSLHTKELLEGMDNIYDISLSGMDIGVPLIDESKFSQLVMEDPESYEPVINKSNLDFNDFLKVELSKLKESISLINQTLQSKDPSKMDEIYLKLNDIDYFFEHFPEECPLSILTYSNLTRFYYTLIRFNRLLTGSKL